MAVQPEAGISRLPKHSARAWFPTAAVWLGAWIVLALLPVIAGNSFSQSLKVSAVITATAIPFSLIWTRFRRAQVSAFEVLGMGLALAFAVSGIALVAVASVGLFRLPWFAIALAGWIALFLISRGQSRVVPSRVSRSQAVAFVSAFVAGGFLLTLQILNTPLFPEVPIDQVERDIYLNAAVGDAVARNGIFGSGILAGTGARYHWLTYAWSGWVAEEVGYSSIEVTVRVIPFVALLIVAGLSSGWLTGRVGSLIGPSIGGVAVVAGTALDLNIWGRFLVGSQSQLVGIAVLFAVIVAFNSSIDSGGTRPVTLILAVLAVALTASKVSVGLMACFGAAVVVFSALRSRDIAWKRALASAITVWTASLVAFIAVAFGQPHSGGLETGGLGFRTSGGLMDVAYGILIAASIAWGTQIVKWIGIGYLVGSREAHNRLMMAWGVSGILFALAGFALLGGVGNEIWFVEAGSMVALLAAALGVACFFEDMRRLDRSSPVSSIFAILGGGLIVAGGAFALNSSLLAADRAYLLVLGPMALVITLAILLSAFRDDRTMRQTVGLAGSIGLVASASMPFLITFLRPPSVDLPSGPRPGHFFGQDALLDSSSIDRQVAIDDAGAAVTWLRTNSSPHDLVASSEPVTTWLPALSGLDMYAANPELIDLWLPNGSLDKFRDRQDLVDRYVTDGDLTTRTRLCEDGVRWLWRGSTNWDEEPEMTHHFGSVTIERVCTTETG